MDKENSEPRGKRLKLVKNTAITYRYLSSATATISPSKRFGARISGRPILPNWKAEPEVYRSEHEMGCEDLCRLERVP